MAGNTETHTRGDRFALYLAVAIAVVVIAWAGWGTAHRIAELKSGHDVPVLVPVTGAQADDLFGFNRTPGIDANVKSISFPLASPALTTLWALWVDLTARFVAVAAGTVVAAKFLYRVARGRVSETGTARLVLVGAGIFAAEWLTHSVVNAVVAPAAVSQYTDGRGQLERVAIDLSPVAWVLFLVAAGVALSVGEKLRRETAGLV